MPTTLEIHPAIGIARVGTSEEFFLGPEPGGEAPARYRDGTGRLKRQGARFRVFECERDDHGELVDARELAPPRHSIHCRPREFTRRSLRH